MRHGKLCPREWAVSARGVWQAFRDPSGEVISLKFLYLPPAARPHFTTDRSLYTPSPKINLHNHACDAMMPRTYYSSALTEWRGRAAPEGTRCRRNQEPHLPNQYGIQYSMPIVFNGLILGVRSGVDRWGRPDHQPRFRRAFSVPGPRWAVVRILLHAIVPRRGEPPSTLYLNFELCLTLRYNSMQHHRAWVTEGFAIATRHSPSGTLSSGIIYISASTPLLN